MYEKIQSIPSWDAVRKKQMFELMKKLETVVCLCFMSCWMPCLVLIQILGKWEYLEWYAAWLSCSAWPTRHKMSATVRMIYGSFSVPWFLPPSTQKSSSNRLRSVQVLWSGASYLSIVCHMPKLSIQRVDGMDACKDGQCVSSGWRQRIDSKRKVSQL